MSKRHHTSRRRTYGRRQHELRERTDRRQAPERDAFAWDDPADASSVDSFAFLDPGTARLRFAMGD